MSEKKRATAKREDYEEPKAPKIRTNHLLIIGIDQYSNGISVLNNAVRDAENFRDLLLKKYQFSKKNLTCLFNKEASRANIIIAFSELLDKLTPDDNLIFYYSGHGEQVQKGTGNRGYWIPADAKMGKDWSYIPNDEIMLLFKNSRAHHVFGIVDSCFSGSLFERRNLTTAEDRISSFPSRWLLTAGRLEPVSDGSLGKNSPFATSLFTYLENYPNDSFWVSDLCNQILKGMSFNSKKQTPRGEPLQDVGHHGGQFVFYKKGVIPQKEEIIHTTPTEEDTKKGLKNTPWTTSEKDVQIAYPTNLKSLKAYLIQLAPLDLENALKQYEGFLKEGSSKKINVPLQLARYIRIKNDLEKEFISYEAASRTYNRIQHAFLNMIDRLEEEDIQLDSNLPTEEI